MYKELVSGKEDMTHDRLSLLLVSLSVSLCVYLSNCLSIYLSVYLALYMFICLSIYQSCVQGSVSLVAACEWPAGLTLRHPQH